MIFRAGFADHSSWDMAFLRIDWNGHGFDAFVTDANLSRVRVSWRMPALPAPDAWHHLAFAWDETVRRAAVRRRQARSRARTRRPISTAGSTSSGSPAACMSPHQVQSRYNFMRGSDLDEIRVYDRMLDAAGVAALAAKQRAGRRRPRPTRRARAAWLHRYGWDKRAPPLLDAPVTRVRKVEFADAKDLKQWMWKGVDGIAETTWPGVYNRSRLPGRDDYFELPDWNTYVEGGKRYDLTVPAGRAVQPGRDARRGLRHAELVERQGRCAHARRRASCAASTRFAPRTGGTLSFTNAMPEQPIQELWAYDVGAGAEPAGSFKLTYTVDAAASPDAGRARRAQRLYRRAATRPTSAATVLALPTSGVQGGGRRGQRPARAARSRGAQARAPIVHILIPASFGDAYPDKPIARAWDYGWQNLHDGLDGIAIDLPALKRADAAG